MNRMMKWLTLLGFVVALIGSIGLHETTLAEGDLEGEFFTGGAIEEGDLGDENTHFYIWLEGESAKALFEQLPGEPKEELCLMDGTMYKNSGDVECTVSADGTAHRCTFAINVPEETIELGSTC